MSPVAESPVTGCQTGARGRLHLLLHSQGLPCRLPVQLALVGFSRCVFVHTGSLIALRGVRGVLSNLAISPASRRACCEKADRTLRCIWTSRLGTSQLAHPNGLLRSGVVP